MKFKKITVLLMLLISVFAIGCEDAKQAEAIEIIPPKFEIIHEEKIDHMNFGCIYIIRDIETGQEYILTEGKFEISITPRLEKEEEQKENE